MNKKTLTALAAAGFVIGATGTNYVMSRIRYRKSIKEIDEQTAREIKILTDAANTIQRRLQTGYYDNKSVVSIMDDFDFEVIALHEK